MVWPTTTAPAATSGSPQPVQSYLAYDNPLLPTPLTVQVSPLNVWVVLSSSLHSPPPRPMTNPVTGLFGFGPTHFSVSPALTCGIVLSPLTTSRGVSLGLTR